jgi:NTP pyrophosphatase (non-canonical NTP hydrolase)
VSEEIKDLTDNIVDWADSVFPDRTPSSALLKLFEEVGELVRDPTSPGEYADIAIMLFDLAHMHDIDLGEAIREKMAVNRARTWRITDTGTLQHLDQSKLYDGVPESEPIRGKADPDVSVWFISFVVGVVIFIILALGMSAL